MRVDILQYRSSDRTIAAATHGRGLFTAQIPAVLPVTLLDFSAQLQHTSVQLSWSTASEQNSKNFEIEKSTNGSSFYKIGTLNAAGQSSTRTDYSYRDEKLGAVNYYRLKMTDADNTSKFSQVVVVKTSNTKQNVWTLNNPFSNYIDLRFAKNTQQVRMQLINMSGRVIEEKIVASPTGQIRWNIQHNLPNGAYLLRTIADSEVFTHKLVKQ